MVKEYPLLIEKKMKDIPSADWNTLEIYSKRAKYLY